MNIAAVPAGTPFLDAIARAWLDAHAAAPEAGLILLPTRRAARALSEAFLNANAGRPLLLPRITAIGALDEAKLALTGALDLPPAIGGAERLALLSRLILGLGGAGGAPRDLDRAWPLAAELASLMDEAERAEIDLRTALPGAADAAHAAHWQTTLRFLAIVTDHWPALLAERGRMNPAAHQVALLDAQARAWTDAPPAEPVWAAGMTSAMPAVARLLRAIAAAPGGLVVLPGLMPAGLTSVGADDTALPPQHPQAGLAAMLAAMGATAGDVRPFPGTVDAGPRPRLLARALLPAEALSAWQNPLPPGDADGLAGMSRLEAADDQAEAVAIAMILRDALETPGMRCALVTPDRALAGRVAAELTRYGVVADDSAGEPVGETPPGTFLRLLAAAIAEDLAPVPLLAVLKHPLAAAGMTPAVCRAAVRRIEIKALRGPRPGPGLPGLRRAVDASRLDAAGLAAFARIEAALAPAFRDRASVRAAPAVRLDALLRAAEALAATGAASGAERLWVNEEGQALAQHLAELRAALAALADHDMAPGALPGLLDAALAGAVVRSRRALRGRDAAAEHPRLFIWGLLEARLQSVDRVVLAGLAEATWPQAADPGPWLSRPMRAAIGLPSPEERVGQAAHDFVQTACAAPEAVLSCPARRDGAPAVPSRFLVRLDAMLAGAGRRLPAHPAAAWAARLDQPARAEPEPAPIPCPPLHLRPRRLSVTQIETWRRDPYAIYARHILRLSALDPLDAAAEAADYGNVVHNGIERVLKAQGPAGWPPTAAALRAAFDAELAEAQLGPALTLWWQTRLGRIADFLAEHEAQRVAELGPPAAIHAEIAGDLTLQGPGGPFVLHGRADRIERHGGTLTVLDYKTGYVPHQSQVELGYSPQMTLLAAMAEAGAFAGVTGSVGALAYWRLTGGRTPGEIKGLFEDDAALRAAIAGALDGLRRLIETYDDPATPYRARPKAGFAPRFSDYALLARVAEWASAPDEEGGA